MRVQISFCVKLEGDKPKFSITNISFDNSPERQPIVSARAHNRRTFRSLYVTIELCSLNKELITGELLPNLRFQKEQQKVKGEDVVKVSTGIRVFYTIRAYRRSSTIKVSRFLKLLHDNTMGTASDDGFL